MLRQVLHPEGRAADAFFHALVQAAPVPMFVIADGRCIYGNDRFLRLRGCPGASIDKCELCGLETLLDENSRQLLQHSLPAWTPGEVLRLPLHLRHEDGRYMAIDLTLSGVEMAGRTCLLGVVSERSEKERLRRLLDRLAFHDSLTELPNRVLLFDRINQALSRMQRDNVHFAVGMLDLDGFKLINDKEGHAAGDMLLKEVARRLRQCVRSVDTVARLGGDEFALILHGISSPEGADTVLRKMIAEIGQPYELDGARVQLGASIGVSFCPQDGASIHELLGRADFAMYLAKKAGGGCYRVSTGEIAPISARHRLEPLIDVVSLGFELIDEQHEALAGAIRGMLHDLSGNASRQQLLQQAQQLEELAQQHFDSEEEYILRYAVSDQEVHRSEHADLLRSLKELLANSEEHGLMVMAHSFREWLQPHIETQDAKLVEQLKLAGVTA
ncbi:MAG: diguanylate cyclase [Pseudomonadota bacterium]